MNRPLISVIIPTYNRSALIGETLDSVLAQTYENWECIVVDDGSTDTTDELMEEYIAKDSRLRYYNRPANKPKGANACRNYGLELAKGDYINWFDSDDLMQPNFLIRKLETITREQSAFVVSKSINFNEEGRYEVKKYKGTLRHELTGKNYILKKVYWMTPDFFIKKECLKDYYFDETLQSGQETNFFIVFLNKTRLKGVAIEDNLTLRRIHSSTIQQKLKKSKIYANRGKLKSLLNAYKQIFKDIDTETKGNMQREIMTTFYLIKLKSIEMKDLIDFTGNLIFNKNPLKASAFFISIFLNSYFNAGYKLFEYSRS